MERLTINEDNKPVIYFNRFAGDKKTLNENEYYECLNCYLIDQLGTDVWTEKLKSEKYFYVYLNNGENEIGMDNFVNSFKDLELLTMDDIINNNDNELDIDFTI